MKKIKAFFSKVKESPSLKAKKLASQASYVAVGAAFPLVSMAASVDYTTTGSGFYDAISGVMGSPLVKGFALVAVLIGILAAAMGNLKAAVLPFGLAAIAGIGPWLVTTIFNLFATVNGA